MDTDNASKSIEVVGNTIPPTNKTITAPLKSLTVKNKLFLQHLVDGKSTLEAYRLSGYKGEPHAAYELRSSLKEDLIHVLEAQGIDRAGLLSELKKLLELPLKDTEITLKYKLDLLKLLAKTLPQTSNDKPKITAFVVNTSVSSNEPTSIETTITDVEDVGR